MRKFISVLFLISIFVLNLYGMNYYGPLDGSSASNDVKLEFYGAKAVLSRDFSTAKEIESGTVISKRGNYFLSFYDYDGGYIETINFKIIKLLGNTIEVTTPDEYYELLKYALENFLTEINFEIKGFSEKTYSLDVINKVLRDYPNLKLGYKSCNSSYSSTASRTKVNIKFKYDFNRAEMLNMSEQTIGKARWILNNIVVPGMKDYQIELAVHDYIVNNTVYDNENFKRNTIPPVSYTDYGILIKGTGVCEGYSAAMNRILNMCGIPAMIVTGSGNGNPHAWNIVKIQGDFYHVDATFNDPVDDNSDKQTISHEYFNLADSQISKDHSWIRKEYVECNSTKYSFNNLNIEEKDENGNTYIPVKSYQEFYDKIKVMLSSRDKTLTLKLFDYKKINYDVTGAVKQSLKDLRLNIGLSWKWTYIDNEISGTRYITIEMQYK